MLRKTLSAITAVVIMSSGLSAEATQKSVDISINNKKGIVVEPRTTVSSTTSATTSTTTSSTTQQTAPTYAYIEDERTESIPSESIPEYMPFKPSPQQVIKPAPSTHGFSDTIIYAGGAKKSYKVGEPIQIRLKLKRKAFIYFWAISASGNGYLILPNSLESYNRYRANMNYVVPERSASYDFISDRAGVEQVYVLATNKKISSSKIKSIFRNRKATNQRIREFITKDIIVVARARKLKYDIASFQIQVHNPIVRRQTAPIQRTDSSVNIIINR